LGRGSLIESKLQAISTTFVNLENATDAMNGQIQDDDQESKENHEGRRNKKRDSVIPKKKKKDMKIMIENLLEKMEEKDQAMKAKDFFIEQFCDKSEREEREKLQQHQRLSEVEEEKENLSEEVRNLVRVLNEKDQDLSLANEKLETERTSASRLQNDLRLQSELRNTQCANCRALQAYLVKEQQERQRLEEELLQSRRNCAELERLLSQSNEQAAQTKDETIREQMCQLGQERELKLGLEERVRRLPTEVDGKRIRRKLHVIEEERPSISNQKKRASPGNSVVEKAQNHVSSNSQDNQRPINFVVNVSTVKIGDLVGEATSPVRIYAEKVFIEMETNEGTKQY